MALTKDAATEFLALTRVAVTGVSANPSGHGSNAVYTRMRDRGYEVFPVNPNSPSAEGDKTYPDLRSIPDGVQAVVIGTRPDRAGATMQEAIDLGITHVWMHRAFGSGSVSRVHFAGMTNEMTKRRPVPSSGCIPTGAVISIFVPACGRIPTGAVMAIFSAASPSRARLPPKM